MGFDPRSVWRGEGKREPAVRDTTQVDAEKAAWRAKKKAARRIRCQGQERRGHVVFVLLFFFDEGTFVRGGFEGTPKGNPNRFIGISYFETNPNGCVF